MRTNLIGFIKVVVLAYLQSSTSLFDGLLRQITLRGFTGTGFGDCDVYH